FLALGWHMEKIHMTWAHLEKKQTRLWTYTMYLEEVLLTEHGNGVASITRYRLDHSSDGVMILMTASGRNRLKSDLEDSIGDGGIVKLPVKSSQPSHQVFGAAAGE
ncbi:hypothetical protein Tco_1280060, partial [Tanacetum coccineum]